MALYGVSGHYRTRGLYPTNAPPTSQRPTMPYAHQINIQVNAEVHFDAESFDHSLATYHELCALHRHTAKVNFNIGQLHLRNTDLRESVSWFENAIRLDPFLAVAHFQAASIYIRLGRLKDAYEAYTRCLNISIRGSVISAGPGTGDVDYDQVGLQYRLYRSDIKQNQRLCECWIKMELSRTQPATNAGREPLEKEKGGNIISVPEGLIFRVPEKLAKARNAKPAETAEWRFRDEARVVAEVPSDSGKMGAWG